MNAFDKLSPQAREEVLHPLLDYLARAERRADGRWTMWQITNLDGGRNNRLYRAACDLGELVVKFTIRDARDRAGREFYALTALRQAGVHIAPVPVLLDRDSYIQPVVVQTWLDGDVDAQVPTTDDGWEKILCHLAAVHTVTPEYVRVALQPGTLCAYNVLEGRRLIQEHVAHIPTQARPATLCDVLQHFESTLLPEWEGKFVSLVRLDNNIRNYIRRPGKWFSVDWENSGWGDPAFDIANLMAHVVYLDVPVSRWAWVAARYGDFVEDAAISTRIQSYRIMMTVWWVVRMARYLYEIPRGLDPRLVEWSDDWLTEMQEKYERYVALAEALLR